MHKKSCANKVVQLFLCIYGDVVTESPNEKQSQDDTPDSGRRITDLAALKVFTHPLRIRLYRALYAAREATASQLSDQVDEAVSLVSYHLRKMAAHGFVVPAEGHEGDARERWWKLSQERGFQFRSRDFGDDPEGAAVLTQVSRQLLATRAERYSQYLDEQAAWPSPWVDAAFTSDYMPRLTAAELQSLAEELGAVMRRWTDLGRAAEEAGDVAGREHVAVQMYGFPTRP